MSDVAYILGGGPSLLDNNFDLIKDEFVIGVNNSIFLGDWVDVCWFGDKKWWGWHKDRLIKEKRKVATCNMKIKGETNHWWKHYKRKGTGINTNSGEIAWNKSSGASAINFAYHMGYRKIVLLGFDMQRINGVKNWHTEHKEKDHSPFKRHLICFPQIAKDAEKLGVQIINATPGSAIKNFPVMTLEEVKRNGWPGIKEKPVVKINNSRLKYVVVFKSGGPYVKENAIAMSNQISRNLTLPHDFICLTDTDVKNNGLINVPLTNNYPGRWSMHEVFRFTGPTIVTGLDTVIVDNIDDLGRLAMECPEDVIYMCTPRNKRQIALGNWASGIMVWNGDWRFIYKNFNYDHHSRHNRREQVYTSGQIKKRIKQGKARIRLIDDHLTGWQRFKTMKDRSTLTEGTKIVTFCGKPRPHNCDIEWVRENYR
jgi:hypothetical protein